ncbi:hypothetical protein [Amphritea japonica]|uniref:Lipoprotein n=1 Tax=Amphritea japonica ATCC BAA-1530 TaxID=1278309 RepID=A0A7R6PKT0_9GAMM|nr:hypothetical protein [Amphritea japonica]BBB26165.1 conserved hypothetical protein [Amphritea japonica ATCC BAA-1530]
MRCRNIKKAKKIVIYAILVMASTSCTGIDKQNDKIAGCSHEWFTLVEKKVPTGDGQGHGPDSGSLEWRSVVEFKLGIRGNAEVPVRDSEAWCNYINKHFIDRR